MPYVSEMIGTSVKDPAGQVVGKVADLLVPAEADYPTVDAVLLKAGRGRTRAIPWSALRVADDGSLALSAPVGEVPEFQPQAHELSLAHQILDRQIIDTNGVRVVRVNDLQLARSDGQFRLVGVDISTAGLLRRLWVGKLLEALGVKLVPRSIPWEDIEPVESGTTDVKLRVPREELGRLHPADLAQIISQLDQHHSREVLTQLDDEAAADAIGEVSPELQVALIKALDAERAADILEEMEPDEAADLLGDLEPERAEDLLSRMEVDEADEVRELLAYRDESAGGLMTTEVVTVPADVTAEEAIALVRAQAASMDNVYDIYVLDEDERLLGTLSLRELIVADPGARIASVMRSDPVLGHPEDPALEVARLIAKYNLLALPIVDDAGRLLGIVTVDDAMDVILPEHWTARVPRVYQRS